MKDWTIRQRILGSFTAILLIIGVMGAIVFHYLQNIEQDVAAIESGSLPGLKYSEQMLSSAYGNYVRSQRQLLLEDALAIRNNEANLYDARASQDDLSRRYEAIIRVPEERALFNKFTAAVAPYRSAQDRILKQSNGQRGKELNALMVQQLDPEFEKVRAALEGLVELNEVNNDRAVDKIKTSAMNAKNGILNSLIVVLLLAFALGYFLLRAITRPMQQLVNVLEIMRQGDFTQRLKADRQDEFGTVSEGFNRMSDELSALVGQVQKSGLQVTTSVTEVAANSRQQQATANEIAATTAEIGATSTEITATSRQLVKTVSEVSTVAEQAAALASSGQTGLSQMGGTMRHVMDATGSINAKLAVLSEKAANINQVITTISKVADQTNLLSLNAAIEAEKAGEHGRGFAVVATEIRRLADQTAVATYDIEQTVKEIQSAVSSSVMSMDKFSEEVRRGMEEVQLIGGQLSQIIQHVQALAPRFEAVNEGMQAQATGAEQITQSLAQLNEAAQQTAESLRQSSMAIDELNQVANGLRGGVSRFKLRA